MKISFRRRKNGKNAYHISKGYVSRTQKLAYIHDMLGELRRVADAESADLLCYLIEMAFIEAGDVIVKTRSIKSGIENKRNKPSHMSL